MFKNLFKKKSPPAQPDYTEALAEIIAAIQCPCEIIPNSQDPSATMAQYHQLLAQGKTEGFTPVIVRASSMLIDCFEYIAEDFGDREAILAAASHLDGKAVLDGLVEDEPLSEDQMGQFIPSEPPTHHQFVYLHPRFDDDMLVMARIPTTNPWEIAAYIPMGDFNGSPDPVEHTAIFKYWYQKYGAIPAVVTGDVWELYVERPPQTEAEVLELALSQYYYCPDVVDQGVGYIHARASELLGAKSWYFWWD